MSHHGRQILKSTSVIAFFTGLTRLLGFVREILMARYFGTTLARSAFDVAFRIPNLFRSILGEGALSAAFVPVFTDSMQKDGEEPAKRVASSIIIFMGCILMTITAVGVLLLVYFGTLRLGESWEAIVPLTGITLPYLLFICVAALCMGVFHSYGRFWVPAASQALLNIVWIVVLLYICPLFGTTPGEQIYAVAWGVLASGALQLGFEAVFLRRIGFNPGIFFDWGSERVRKFLKLMTPVVFGNGITALNVCISTLLAFYAGTWAPAALTYAERLIYLPLGLFATALGSVLLPTFSRQASLQARDDLVRTLNGAIRSICFVMTPVAAGIFILALPFVKLVFERGHFTADSSVLTARALMAYAPGLIAFSIYKMVLPAFYGLQDTKTPVRVAVCSAFLNLLLNVLSILFLPDGYKHAGLAGANVVSSILASAVLLVVMHRKIGGLKFMHTGWSVVSTLMSGVLMAITVMRVYAACSARWLSGSGGRVPEMLCMAAAVAAGLAVYTGARMIVSPQETVEAFRILRSRGKRRG